jgi:spore germination protein KB
MLEKGNITACQFTILTFLFTVGTTILVIPSGLAANAKQDAWIGAIAGVVLNLLIVWLFSTIWSRFPNLNFIGLCEKALGKFFGNIVSCLFIIYSFVGSTTVLTYVGYFMTTEILIRTPIHFINLIFAVIIILGVRLGIEPIARTGEILFPWVNLLLFIFILSSLPLIRIQNILPILESGIKPILLDALSVVVYPSMGYMQAWDSSIFLPYILTIGLFIPLLLFGMVLLRERWDKKEKNLS